MLEKYYKNAIDDAINSLKDDGVIILPTDTVYGLAALSSSKVAIERIYRTGRFGIGLFRNKCHS